jgi:hypothetical protein
MQEHPLFNDNPTHQKNIYIPFSSFSIFITLSSLKALLKIEAIFVKVGRL